MAAGDPRLAAVEEGPGAPVEQAVAVEDLKELVGRTDHFPLSPIPAED